MPTYPSGLSNHDMVTVGHDLLVIGGRNGTDPDTFSDSLFKLSCTLNLCHWETLFQKLEFPRYDFVAIPVPNDFINCN